MPRFLITLAIFLELALLLSAAALVTVGASNPGQTAWILGIILAFSAATVFLLPPRLKTKLGLHVALIAGSAIFFIPFFWLVTTSFKYPEETFTFPPRWIPEIPRANAPSPYLAGEDLGPAPTLDWSTLRTAIPPDQLAAITEPIAQANFPRELQKAMEASGHPTPTPELTREVWDKIYRGVGIGALSLRDKDELTSAVKDADITWSFQNCAPQGPAAHVVKYDLSKDDSFAITAHIPSSAVPAELAQVTIPVRQDRSWQRLQVLISWHGQTYASTDMLYLGSRAAIDLTFKLPPTSPTPIDTENFSRDERSQGIWFTTQVAATPQPPDELTLTVRVDRTNRVSAALAKYFETYRTAWYADPYWGKYLVNSVIIVILSVLGSMLSCSMVAYAFARLRWPGRDFLFLILLGTMMLPAQVTMIPSFMIFRSLGWYNTLLPLWVPALLGGAFFIFMLRQFMKAIPRELEEAALIDGCSWFNIYWRVILPLMKPALAAVAIFTFMNVWNEFMGPLIYLSDARNYPLSLGLYNFRTGHSTDFGMLMAASTMLTLPVIALFFVAQRFFIQGITLSGLKA